MRNPMKYIIYLAVATAGVPAVAPRTAAAQTLSESTANAIREHVDEAEDLTESLLRWKHIVTGIADGDIDLRKPPANTSISIDRSDAQRLSDLTAALMAQVPRNAGSTVTRGDLRSHVEKAQQIAGELLPSDSKTTASRENRNSAGTANLVTIDRTSLERLDIELDAIEMILPRVTRPASY